MKCVICHGDDIEVRDVREDLRVGTDVIEVPIKVLVCGTCGERYYDRRTVRYLKEIERKLKAGTTKLREVGKVRVYGHSE